MHCTKEYNTESREKYNISVFDFQACTWLASLVALLFGVFKCRSFAEVLFGLSETDAQLELQEKHYDKIKRKSMYWIVFLALLLAGHAVSMYQILKDSVGFDILILLADTMAHSTLFVLDLQYLYMIMVLCKRYRLCNKILVHITKVNLAFFKETFCVIFQHCAAL